MRPTAAADAGRGRTLTVGFHFYPSPGPRRTGRCASCTTFLCLCKRVKELSLSRQTRPSAGKRVQRYGEYSEPANFLANIFQCSRRKPRLLDKGQAKDRIQPPKTSAAWPQEKYRDCVRKVQGLCTNGTGTVYETYRDCVRMVHGPCTNVYGLCKNNTTSRYD